MELKKICSVKRMITVALLFLLTIGIYLYQNKKSSDAESALTYAEQQAAYVETYHESIEQIIANSKRLANTSLFQETDSYSYRNVAKTEKAYEKMLQVQPEKGNYQGLESILQYHDAEFFFFLLIVIAVLSFFDEEKKGLKIITYATPRGRGRAALAKIGSLGIISAVGVLFTYGVLFCCSAGLYGIPDSVKAPVQSMTIMGNCTMNLNIGVFFLCDLLIHIMKTWALAIIVWMIMLAFRNLFLSFALLVGILGVEGIAYSLIKTQNVLVGFKFLNLFYVVWSGENRYIYRNWNLNGYPVGCLTAMFVVSLIGAAIGIFVCVTVSEKRKSIFQVNAFFRLLKKTGRRLKQGFHRCIQRMSVFAAEIYKILFVHKGIVLCIVWIAILIYRMDLSGTIKLGEAALMDEVYAEYTGRDDGRLREFAEEQERIYNQATEDFLQAVQAYENGEIETTEYELAALIFQSYDGVKNRLALIRKRLDYMEEQKTEKNIDAWFLDEKGYQILFTQNGYYGDSFYRQQEFRAILTAGLVILLLGSVFSYDRECGIAPVLQCTPKGRKKLFRIKFGAVAWITVIAAVAAYGLELFEVNYVYHLGSLCAPVQSLTFMGDFPWRISIGGYLAIVEIIHVLVLFMAAWIVCALTSWMKPVYGMAVSAVIVLGPAVLKYMGINRMQYLSVIHAMVASEPMLEQGLGFTLCMLAVIIAVGVFAMLYTRNRWCNYNHGVVKK